MPEYLGDREDGAAVDRVVAELRARAGEQIHTGQVLAVTEARTRHAGRPGQREGDVMPAEMAALAMDLAAETAATVRLPMRLVAPAVRTSTERLNDVQLT